MQKWTRKRSIWFLTLALQLIVVLLFTAYTEKALSATKKMVQTQRLVIFACPKGPKYEKTALQEEIALKSWVFWLDPPADLVVVLQVEPDSETAQLAKRISAEVAEAGLPTRVVSEILTENATITSADGDSGPNVSAIFAAAENIVAPRECCAADLFMYVNSDLLLPMNAVTQIKRTMHMMNSFLPSYNRTLNREIVLSGSRHDCFNNSRNLRLALSNANGTQDIENLYERCVPRRPTAKDYWVYTRGFWSRSGGIPSFMLGRTHWDNHLTLVANTFSNLVDMSPILDVLHLEHTYGLSSERSQVAVWNGVAAKENALLARGAWRSLGRSQPTFGSNLNEVKWRACPLNDKIGNSFWIEPAQMWKSDTKWQHNIEQILRRKGRCSFASEIYSCRTPCASSTSA